MYHFNTVPGIAFGTVAAACHEAAQPSEAVGHGDRGGSQIRHGAEITDVVAVAVQETARHEIDDDEHSRSADESAVEGRARGVDDLKLALGHKVVEGLEQNGGAVAQHHGGDGIEQDEVLKLGLKPSPIGLETDEQHADDHSHRQQDGVQIHAKYNFVWVHKVVS